jgi:hypothetical protein
MEALVRVLLCGFSAYTVYSSSLPIVNGSLADTLNCGAQVIMERAEDGTADVVSEIPGTDKEDIDTRNLCNLFHLDFCG